MIVSMPFYLSDTEKKINKTRKGNILKEIGGWGDDRKKNGRCSGKSNQIS